MRKYVIVLIQHDRQEGSRFLPKNLAEDVLLAAAKPCVGPCENYVHAGRHGNADLQHHGAHSEARDGVRGSV